MSRLIDVSLKYGSEAPMSHFLLNACRLDSSLLLPLPCRLRSDVREEGLRHQERRRGGRVYKGNLVRPDILAVHISSRPDMARSKTHTATWLLSLIAPCVSFHNTHKKKKTCRLNHTPACLGLILQVGLSQQKNAHSAHIGYRHSVYRMSTVGHPASLCFLAAPA